MIYLKRFKKLLREEQHRINSMYCRGSQIQWTKDHLTLTKDRAQVWGANDAFEDGYPEKTAADKKRYESDPSDKLDRNFQRAPLSNPFSQGGNWFRKTINRREGEPYFKPLGGNHCRILNIGLH